MNMKLTKSKLKQIIKEELDTLMNEEQMDCAEIKKQLSIVGGKIQSSDPMSGGIGNLYEEEEELKEKAKSQGCP